MDGHEVARETDEYFFTLHDRMLDLFTQNIERTERELILRGKTEQVGDAALEVCADVGLFERRGVVEGEELSALEASAERRIRDESGRCYVETSLGRRYYAWCERMHREDPEGKLLLARRAAMSL
jgi:hypothetical protein